MPYGMYISAAGAHVQSQRLQVLANNLANVDTPGFQREFSVFQARPSEEIERGQLAAGGRSFQDLSGGVTLAETVTGFQPGKLQPTGNPTDWALRGQGFFLVAKDGEQFLTRAGNFQLDTEGRLVTSQGYEVLAADRQAITLNRNLPWELLPQGVVAQGATQIPVAIVSPAAPSDLQKTGEALFTSTSEVDDLPLNDRGVVQGFLEKSTVEPAAEMIELIETSRAYEANIRMIQNQDQLLSSLVNRVLRV